MRSRSVLIALVGALAVSTLPASAAPAEKSTYIVKVVPGKSAAAEKALTNGGGSVKRSYANVFEGFLVELPDAAANGLSKNPNIEILEKDAAVEASDIQSPTPSWGLDRVDQRTAVSGTSSFGYVSAGAGATAYIADTGIYPHNDFAGRLSSVGYSGIADGNGTVDCNGHGTHVAGTVAGTTYGIAKKATLVPVRVLGCDGRGSYSTVIAGLDWILSSANTNSKTAAVVNMSLGGGTSTTVDAAVKRLTDSGIVVVVAAGNSNVDACTTSPARALSAITVGATTNVDYKASYSNWGSCVDINAPGSSITSSWFGSATATNTISGTSMASPHVAGAAAVYMGLNPTASVATVTQALNAAATKDVLKGLTNGTANSLVYVSPTDGAPDFTAPTIAYRSTSSITSTSATVSYDVNPGGSTLDVSVQYAKTADFASAITVTPTPSSVSGTSVVTVSASLTGLTASTTYYVRATAGTVTTAANTFVSSAAAKTKPGARTKAVSNITATGAFLGGFVTPGNDSTSVSFVYGTDPNFVTNTKTVAASPATVTGNSEVSVASAVASLASSTTYYVKVVATNSVGSTSSDVATFTTSAAATPTPTPTPSPTPTPTPTPAPTKKAQAITFPAIADREFGPGAPLLATSSSGLAITYTSLTPTICTAYNSPTKPFVQSVGRIAGTGPWVCTVRASQAGNTEFAAATPVDRTFNWLANKMYIKVTSSTNLKAGTNAVVSAVRFVDEPLNSGLTSIGHLLTVTSQTPTVCRVDSNSTWDQPGGILNRAFVTGLAAGTCTLKFDFAGTSTRNAATLTWNGTVKK